MFESLGVVDYPTFLVASLLIVLCPGPNSLYVLRTSVSDGARVGFAGACGVFLGDSILILAVYLGVAALILANPSVFFVLKCAGAAYLTWLAFRILTGLWKDLKKAPPATSGEAVTLSEKKTEKPKIAPKTAFRTALVLSLSNPKAILFMLSFFQNPILFSRSLPPIVGSHLICSFQYPRSVSVLSHSDTVRPAA